MKNPRIVLDTNCLLQILGAKSRYHFLFQQFLANQFTLCLSTDILLEYEEILRQKASATAAELFLMVIARSQNIVRKDPYFRLGLVTRDEDDNKFTDCAFICQADFIITNDGHFREVTETPFPKIEILSLDEFASMMKQS